MCFSRIFVLKLWLRTIKIPLKRTKRTKKYFFMWKYLFFKGFPNPKMDSRERPCHSSSFQKFSWLALFHSGVEDLQFIFSFRSNKFEVLSLYVKNVYYFMSHLRSKLKMHYLTPPYNCVLGLIRCSASVVQHKVRNRP